MRRGSMVVLGLATSASRDQPALTVDTSYEDMSLLSLPGTGVYAVSVWRPGTRTTSGIALGDPLARAR